MSKIKAAVTLPAIILIGGLILEMGIVGAFMAQHLAQSGFGIKFSEEALAAARAGIQDAQMMIVRNKKFNPDPNPYTLIIGNRVAEIRVCEEKRTVSSPCDTTMAGKYEITSLGKAFAKHRQIRSIVSVDGLTGEMRIESEKEMQL